jgi:hypothetical protein
VARCCRKRGLLGFLADTFASAASPDGTAANALARVLSFATPLSASDPTLAEQGKSPKGLMTRSRRRVGHRALRISTCARMSRGRRRQRRSTLHPGTAAEDPQQAEDLVQSPDCAAPTLLPASHRDPPRCPEIRTPSPLASAPPERMAWFKETSPP